LVVKVVLSKKKMVLAREIKTGIELNDFIQVLEGLGVKETIADNAQYLMDSESFIKKQNNYAKEIQFPVPGICCCGCNTKNKKIIAHQEGESIFYTCSMDPQIRRQAW
jgi:hypothetical protein